MKKCPKCKMEYFICDSFCREDGTKLLSIEKPKCPECGKSIYSGKFCANCGIKLDKKLAVK